MAKLVDMTNFMDSLLDDPEVKAEYKRLQPQFDLFLEMVKARQSVNLDQAAVAERMKTSRSAIARIESPNAKTRPSWNTIERYAEAIGMQARVVFEPIEGVTPTRRKLGPADRARISSTALKTTAGRKASEQSAAKRLVSVVDADGHQIGYARIDPNGRPKLLRSRAMDRSREKV